MKRESGPRARKEIVRFIKKSEARVQLQLVIEFDRPESLATIHEVARKVVDRVRLEPVALEDPVESLDRVTLRCGELRRGWTLWKRD